ncbi:hypothetical protein EMIT0373P_40533 [Pseudomonas chlororaphis]
MRLLRAIERRRPLLQKMIAALTVLATPLRFCRSGRRDSADVLRRLDYGPCGTDRSLASSTAATQRLHTVHTVCAWHRLRSDYVTVT